MNKLYFKLIENLPINPDSPIKGKDLARKLNVTQPTLRKMIETLREQGYPITMSNKYPSGYWLTNNYDEIDKAVSTIKSHAQAELKTSKNLELAIPMTKKQALKQIKKEITNV